MELSKHLRDVSRTIAGKEQMLISAIARALEVIPRQLCDNAGFDSTNILNKLRQKHAQGNYIDLKIIGSFHSSTFSIKVIAGWVSTFLTKMLPTTWKSVFGNLLW